ncbi:hypothetical protein CJ030_MR8G017919 [Morella rubra]|uniref:Uncharacterized protein n=1 Tax=Morella rubra TaxID=262757 RepID=A0A6A1URI6_9ROSI|nr:hypothetical protein CJ030_MR8G017919 [Morella rubra]
MKQINSTIQSSINETHILAGGLNSLDETVYSQERWTDIVRYHEEIGKPTPKVEVMRFLKSKQYADAKDFAGECESVVMIAKKSAAALPKKMSEESSHNQSGKCKDNRVFSIKRFMKTQSLRER